MIFKKYYQPRKGYYSEENKKLADELTKTQREPTEVEKKIVKFYNEKTRDYQDAINKMLGTNLFLLQLELKTLDTLYEKIKEKIK